MSELATAALAKRRRSHFFVWMAGVCMFFAFAGFTPTYFAPIAKGTLEGISPVVHIHGLLFFSWTIFSFCSRG